MGVRSKGLGHLRRVAAVLALSLAAWLFGLLGLSGAGQRAWAEPALWVVKSRTATVFLFGTVHLLKPASRWETPRIRDAFERSDELWLEVPDGGDAAAAEPAVNRLGFDRRTPLTQKLTPYDRDRLEACAHALGEPLSDFEPMRPWLAAVRLSIAPMVKAGYDPEAGVDRTLKRQADLDRRPVKAFETVEQQIHNFADMPEPLQLSQLHLALNAFPRDAGRQKALEKAWEAGDTRAIWGALDADLHRAGRGLYKALFLARNRVYAAGVARRLHGRGTAFVAVGAGHLAGPDGLPALLARQGLQVRRL
jgi:uncharacterized protein YbaP (TraB family)